MVGDIQISDLEEKYWVGRTWQDPERLYFNEIDAFVSGHNFLDAFDLSGEWVAGYKFVGDSYIMYR